MNGDRICKSDILQFLSIVPENIQLTVKADAAKLIVVLILLYLNDKPCLAVGNVFGVFGLHNTIAKSENGVFEPDLRLVRRRRIDSCLNLPVIFVDGVKSP